MIQGEYAVTNIDDYSKILVVCFDGTHILASTEVPTELFKTGMHTRARYDTVIADAIYTTDKITITLVGAVFCNVYGII